MANVSPIFQQRWASGRHVGIAKPNQKVEIQRGLMDHHYARLVFLDGTSDADFGFIAGGSHNERPWQAYWRPTGPWITVPNVLSVQSDQGFDDGGVGTATITIENVLYKRAVTVFGAYTLMQRGGLSPTLGWRSFGRPITDQQINEWYQVLNGGYRIRVSQGYGDALEPVFAGLIGDTDINVTPDQVVLTCRSFGQLLTDQRVFGWSKAKELRSPIIFADRLKATNIKKVSAGARALTSHVRHPPKNVGKPDDSYWLSGPHGEAERTEWIEFHVPKGTYKEFYIDPRYNGHRMWVSVKASNAGLGKGKKCKVNGQPVDNGWVRINDRPANWRPEDGIVPGDNGGHPFINYFKSLTAAGNGRKYKLGAELYLGNDSIVRFSFRGLHEGTGGLYRAGIRRLLVYREQLTEEAKKKKWILVDDAADVVKWALMWAGFKEWEVESFGARLKDPKVFHQSDYLMDIVKWVESQADYRFFMGRPSVAQDSIGVPIFRHTRALTPAMPGMVEVSDRTILTNLQRKFTKDPYAYLIRVRGRMRNKKRGGVTSGEDRIRRVQQTYYPPWSGAHRVMSTGKYDPKQSFTGVLSGVQKYVVHTDNLVQDEADAMTMALLIAIQQQLAAETGTIEIPGHAGIELDDQISAVDGPSGTNSRLWIAQKSTNFTSGPDASWTMSLGGSLVDSEYMLAIAYDFLQLAAKVRNGE